MKIKFAISILLFAFIASTCIAQNSSKIDAFMFSEFVTNKTTLKEVKNNLGTPDEEYQSPNSAMLHYKNGDELIIIRFNEEKKLESMHYSNKQKLNGDALPYTSVKKLIRKCRSNSL